MSKLEILSYAIIVILMVLFISFIGISITNQKQEHYNNLSIDEKFCHNLFEGKPCCYQCLNFNMKYFNYHSNFYEESCRCINDKDIIRIY